MTDGIPDGGITLVFPCPALTHTYVKIPQILYVSQYTFVETLAQAFKRMVCTHGQTHIRKNASNPVCVSVYIFQNLGTVP